MKEKILELLGKHDMPLSPTQIGMYLGKNYNTASSSVSSHLKALVIAGKVIKDTQNGVRYKLPLTNNP